MITEEGQTCACMCEAAGFRIAYRKIKAENAQLLAENNLLREFIAALPAPTGSRHFEEFQPSPESVRAWEGVDVDKWLETLRGHDTPETEVDL